MQIRSAPMSLPVDRKRTKLAPPEHFRFLDVELAHSGLILASRITLAHFSVSSAMSLPNS
jgi:hypothetical protein